MTSTLPFLTSYDPPGTSEGTLDPMGLYQIADQLAVQLVPAVRERMQRIRFLTAMAVGTLVTEGIDDDPALRDASPYLVWEWLVVEAIIRSMDDFTHLWGVPGTDVASRALDHYGYIDARSYLKTPRVFGFNGVYKRLAIHLGIVDVHLGPGPNAEVLADAWARGLGLSGITDAKPMISRWSDAVHRSLNERPPRTNSHWSNERWNELAQAFLPTTCKGREKRLIRELLHSADNRRLGALPIIWQLQNEFKEEDEYSEEVLHDRISALEPAYKMLLKAIRDYEGFARGLHDGFDVLRSEATRLDANGYSISDIANDKDFKQSIKGLHKRFEETHRSLGEITLTSMSLQNLFSERFGVFSEPLDARECAYAICTHHEAVQEAKSAEGKRSWFDRIGPAKIYLRHAYRAKRRDIYPGKYVHDYRGNPIRRFWLDLS